MKFCPKRETYLEKRVLITRDLHSRHDNENQCYDIAVFSVDKAFARDRF